MTYSNLSIIDFLFRLCTLVRGCVEPKAKAHPHLVEGAVVRRAVLCKRRSQGTGKLVAALLPVSVLSLTNCSYQRAFKG